MVTWEIVGQDRGLAEGSPRAVFGHVVDIMKVGAAGTAVDAGITGLECQSSYQATGTARLSSCLVSLGTYGDRGAEWCL